VSVFERYLTVWVLLCIVVGIALGQYLPGAFQVIGALSVARVNLPVGVLIWVMIIPMLVKVDFGALGQIRQHVKGIGVILFVNWLVKPFSMASRSPSCCLSSVSSTDRRTGMNTPADRWR
jgi:ACR3 family arsenite transporter